RVRVNGNWKREGVDAAPAGVGLGLDAQSNCDDRAIVGAWSPERDEVSRAVWRRRRRAHQSADGAIGLARKYHRDEQENGFAHQPTVSAVAGLWFVTATMASDFGRARWRLPR